MLSATYLPAVETSPYWPAAKKTEYVMQLGGLDGSGDDTWRNLVVIGGITLLGLLGVALYLGSAAKSEGVTFDGEY